MIEKIIKSNSGKTITILFADGAYRNDIFRYLSDNGILIRFKVRKNAKVRLKLNSSCTYQFFWKDVILKDVEIVENRCGYGNNIFFYQEIVW